MQTDGVQLPLMPIDENITANPIPKNAAFAAAKPVKMRGGESYRYRPAEKWKRIVSGSFFLALLSDQLDCQDKGQNRPHRPL